MLDTVVISGEDVCYSVVFVTLVGVSVFSLMWSEFLMPFAITLCGWCGDCDACTVICVGCEYAERVRDREVVGNAGLGTVGGVVVKSARHEYMGGTRCSAIVSSADDVLECDVWDKRRWWSVNCTDKSKITTPHSPTTKNTQTQESYNTNYTTDINTNPNNINNSQIKTTMKHIHTTIHQHIH